MEEEVFIGAIGKCPRCNEYLKLPAEVLMECMPAPLQCKCGATITAQSQGRVCVDGTWQQVRWLDKYGQWTDTKSNKPFVLQGECRRWLVFTDYCDILPLDESGRRPLSKRLWPRLATDNGKRV